MPPRLRGAMAGRPATHTALAASALVLVPSLLPAADPAAASVAPQVDEAARMPGVPFEELARRAHEAAEAGRLDEAGRFYRAGLALNPRWADGWWRLALLDFDAARYEAARDSLLRLVELDGDSGPSWALLGLSEYKLEDYSRALLALSRAVARGVPETEPIGREALHYMTLLLVRDGQFAASARHLARLSQLEPGDPELVAACGLMALRMPRLPSEVPEGDRELVLAAGVAAHAAFAYREREAEQAFEALIARFPRARGVHFAYGLYLTRHASPRALSMLQREVELHPDHLDAHLEIAFAILDRGDPQEALPSAREACRLAPESAAAQLVLGRALVATGALEEGIAALELSARLQPDVRDVHLALAQAYARAGRTEDVRRVREKLIELDSRRGAQ